jgi:hypothetical protein
MQAFERRSMATCRSASSPSRLRQDRDTGHEHRPLGHPEGDWRDPRTHGPVGPGWSANFTERRRLSRQGDLRHG